MEPNEESDESKNNPPVRQHLVDSAVGFLLHPHIYEKPEEKKKAFLRQKDLTDAEIALAFQLAQKSDPSSPPIPPRGESCAVTPYGPNIQQFSIWHRMRRVGSSIIILGVALYGLHHFYQLYIEPWLFGKQSRLNLVESHLQEISSSIAQLSNSVLVLEGAVNNQKLQMDNYLMTEIPGCKPIPIVLSELKMEVEKIKSILTSRHQFPAIPKVVAPSIPDWQKSTPKEEKSENETCPETDLLLNGNHESDIEADITTESTTICDDEE